MPFEYFDRRDIGGVFHHVQIGFGTDPQPSSGIFMQGIHCCNTACLFDEFSLEKRPDFIRASLAMEKPVGGTNP